jgi:hypothetical protein
MATVAGKVGILMETTVAWVSRNYLPEVPEKEDNPESAYSV